MSVQISCTPDQFLASTADLANLLAQFTSSRPSRSAERRRDRQLAEIAPSDFLQVAFPAEQPRRTSACAGGAAIPGAPKTFNRLSVPVETEGRRSGVRQRQYCQCGQCKWCLDNARWERIFNEKFLDPTYYAGLSVRHSSTLAQARR